MNFIFHFISGMSSFSLTNIFQDCFYTTNQLWFLWIVRQRSPGPVRSPCPPCATQQSHAAAQPPKQPRNQQKEPSSHQSKQQQPQEKPSSSRSNQPAPPTLLSTFLPRPRAANICNLENGAAPRSSGAYSLTAKASTYTLKIGLTRRAGVRILAGPLCKGWCDQSFVFPALLGHGFVLPTTASQNPFFSGLLLLKISKSVVLRNLCLIFYCFVSRRSGPGRSRSGPRSAACPACPVRVALVEQAPGPPPVFGTRHRPGLGRLQRHGDVLREGLPLGGGAAVASRGAVDGGFTREKRGI